MTMANTNYYQVTLSVRPKSGGAAELALPKSLEGINYGYMIVKDGGTEAIVWVQASEAQLKKLDADPLCKKLTGKQLESLQKSYPAPKLKKVYRLRTIEDAHENNPASPYETDKNGNPIVDTVQTIRAGFYLIDVPVTEAEH